MQTKNKTTHFFSITFKMVTSIPSAKSTGYEVGIKNLQTRAIQKNQHQSSIIDGPELNYVIIYYNLCTSCFFFFINGRLKPSTDKGCQKLKFSKFDQTIKWWTTCNHVRLFTRTTYCLH